MLRRLKALARPLLRTPLHPQWLVTLGNARWRAWAGELAHGSRVLDIGCAGQEKRAALPADCLYVGLDYPATAAAYRTRPMVYGDAHRLPCADRSFDLVLLTDVLEHLRDPLCALAEVRRVLRPGGRLLVGVPFLYPVHDAPHDYSRWTDAGLREMAARLGFVVARQDHRGEPLESAALLFNIALVHSALEAMRRRSAGILLVPLVPPVVLVVNVLGYVLARLFPRSALMPYAHLGLWSRGSDA